MKNEAPKNLEKAKELIAKLEQLLEEKTKEITETKDQLQQKTEDWQKLASTFESEVKKQVEEKVDKLKGKDGEKTDTDQDQSHPITWEQIKMPAIIIGGLLIIFFLWKLACSKFSSK